MITFAHPYILLLLWLLPLLLWYWDFLYRKKEEKIRHFISTAMQKKLRFIVSRKKFILQISALAIAIILLIISVAGPFNGYKKEEIKIPAHKIVMVIDVSRSMTAKDILPNRLTAAKNILLEITGKLNHDYIALVTFRKKAIVNSPLTDDYLYLQNCIKQTSIQSAPPGETDIGAAIITAASLFKTNDNSRKVIILLSDGEDLAGRINQAENILRRNKITLFSVGIGTEKGTIIPGTENNKPMITKLYPEVLKQLADAGNGRYIPIKNNNISGSSILFADINKIKRNEVAISMHRLRIYQYNIFLLPAFIILLLLITTAVSIPSTTTAKKNTVKIITFIIALYAGTAHAADSADVIKQYNTAANEFASGNLQQAINILDKIKDNYDKVKIDNAYGCIYFRLAQQAEQLCEQNKFYEKSAEYFQSALYNKQGNKNIEHNLAIAYKQFITTIPDKEISEKLATKQHTSQKTNNNKATSQPLTNATEQSNETYYKNITNREIDNILDVMLNRENSYKDKIINRTKNINPNIRDR